MAAQTCTPVVDGVHYIQWIHTLFGDCVYGWQECISLLLGYLSILCWLNAQMPQVIKNYRLQDAESLSFTFLTVWLTGDVANFIGCILTGQMDFQVYLSIYFILVDTVLCLQWLYYVKYPTNWIRAMFNPTIRAALRKEEEQLLVKDDVPRYQSTSPSSSRTLLAIGFLFTLSYMSPETSELSSLATHDATASWDDRDLWIGRFFAWVCTCLYLSSRVPQIYLNFKRRSVEGLAMTMFLSAAAGNFTYTLGIFTNPHQTRQTLLEAVPYILGSAGTLCFDATIYIQNLLYNNNTQEKRNAVERLLEA
ncbi:PQ loop repeat-domain-containing protein [Fennellomyces sp. T-0311]|nr:PQ loop repeat-domain-containing protein [Fennellomyces sp. T-0311]